MRLYALVLLAAVAGAEDLRPREGSGWAGFGVGSWIRVKLTTIQPGRVPKVIIWKQSLKKVGAKALTLETVSRNALGMEQRSSQQLPPAGEAAPGETQKVEKLKGEVVVAAGKRLDCTRRRTTVTGPRGKRVITAWTAAEPPVLAKRTEAIYDSKGKLVYRVTRLLSSLSEPGKVGGRTVRCVKYKRRVSYQDGRVVTGVALSSREVPGGLVRQEEETTRGAEKLMTTRVELLAFLAK